MSRLTRNTFSAIDMAACFLLGVLAGVSGTFILHTTFFP